MATTKSPLFGRSRQVLIGLGWVVLPVVTLAIETATHPQAYYYRVHFDLADTSLNIRSTNSADEDRTIIGNLPEGFFFVGTQEDPKTNWQTLNAVDRNGRRVKAYVNSGRNAAFADRLKTSDQLVLHLNPQMANSTGVTTLYSSPGFDFKSCELPMCKKVAWPHLVTDFTLRNTRIQEVEDPDSITGYSWQTYYQVEYDNLGKLEVGWIRGDYFLNGQDESQLGCQGKAGSCSTSRSSSQRLQDLSEAVRKAQAAQTSAQLKSEAIAEVLASKMGLCLLSSRSLDKNGNFAVGPKIQNGKGNVVDKTVVAHWRGIKAPLAVRYKNKQANKVETKTLQVKDLIAIDALARTLYGEMSMCDKKHGHNAYSTAVAAMVNNRRIALQGHLPGAQRFGRSPLNPKMRSPLTDVVSSPAQFSVWNFDEAALQKALCPPAHSGEDYWRGHPPDDKYVQIWQKMLATAIEVTIYPEQFRGRTSGINGFFYTSRVDWRSQFDTEEARAKISEARQAPKLQGVVLNDRQCLRFWHESSVPSLNSDQ